MSAGQSEGGEKLVMITDEHWVKYVMPSLIAALLFGISMLLLLLAGLAAHHYMWLSHASFIAGMLLFLLTLHWFFMVLLSETLDQIIITNRRLLRMKCRLLFGEDILEISFDKMKTVDASKTGIFQNLLRYGTLYFESKLASIALVPHPNKVAAVIQEAMHEWGK